MAKTVVQDTKNSDHFARRPRLYRSLTDMPEGRQSESLSTDNSKNRKRAKIHYLVPRHKEMLYNPNFIMVESDNFNLAGSIRSQPSRCRLPNKAEAKTE